MATGDKIYLADKATLDLVKATVDNINTQSDNIRGDLHTINTRTTNIIGELSTLRGMLGSLSSGLQNIGASSHTISDIRQSRQGISNIPISSSYVTVTSLSGSGELHYMLAQSPTTTSSANNIYMQVIVDGITIYNSTAYTAANNAGNNVAIFSKDSSMGLDSQNLTRLVGGHILTSRAIAALSNDSVNRHQTIQTEHVMSLKPIRWNSSLEIRAYATAINSTLHYFYELD